MGTIPLKKMGTVPFFFMKRGGKNSKKKRIEKELSLYSLYFINLWTILYSTIYYTTQ
jgi:hypothetical protein